MSYLKQRNRRSKKLKSAKRITAKVINISSKRKYNNRFSWIWIIMIGAMLILSIRLYYLQIITGEKLAKEASSHQETSLIPYKPRRSIVDKDNNLLANDELTYSLYIHPRYFTVKPEIVAEKISEIIPDNSAAELLERFKTQRSGIKIADDLPEYIAEKIKNIRVDGKGLNGVELGKEYARFYPQGETIAEVVGYVDQEHQGQAGLEYSQEDIIKNNVTYDQFAAHQTAKGSVIPAGIPSELIKVDDLRLKLTVDLDVQKVARTALKKQMQRYNAKRGAVLVMDVNNGSLLAMVSEPTYDPNKYSDYPVELFKNWAVTDLYEPGSTFKPINVAIALEMGVIEPNTIVHDTGKVKIDVWEVKNHDYDEDGPHGYINIAQVLQKSSNVGMINIMKRIPPRDFYRQLENLGLKDNVGVDLPSDTPGHLKPEVEFLSHEIEPATASFGQGFALTPLKLLQLNAILANGGYMVTPHVIQGLTDSNGKVHWQPSYNKKKIFSSETTQAVLAMMETVVEDGSGTNALIPGYRIAGKTGTSQKAAYGGYHSSARITSFVGILPVSSPRYAVLAVIDEPKGSFLFGSTVAAPIVGEVMQSLIAIDGIPPDGD